MQWFFFICFSPFIGFLAAKAAASLSLL